MGSDLVAVIILAAFIIVGFTRPAVATCAVVWVDLYKPQILSFSFLSGKPISMIIVAYCFLIYLICQKKLSFPRRRAYVVLMPLFMAWITITTMRALFPEAAWIKHDFAFKTMLVTLLIPFAIQNRSQFELLLWTIFCALGYFMFSSGIKSVFGGGGYNVALITSPRGIYWDEGSTLAAQSIAMIPIIVYLAKYSMMAASKPWLRKFLWLVAASGVLLLVGTQARTGLVTLAFLVLLYFLYSRHKLRIGMVVLLIPILALPFMPSAWTDRMSTIFSSNEDSSAVGRLLVWRWTIDFANRNPVFGGGFHAYLANAGQLTDYQEHDEADIFMEKAKAYHNIFFEVLGEHGYVGLIIFLLIIGHTYKILIGYYRNPGSEDWQRSFGLLGMMSITTFCVGGMFIGVAFSPWIYLMYAIAVSFDNANYAKRKESPQSGNLTS